MSKKNKKRDKNMGAKEKVVSAIERIVQAAKELSLAEAEYLDSRNVNKGGTVKLICGVAIDEQDAANE